MIANYIWYLVAIPVAAAPLAYVSVELYSAKLDADVLRNEKVVMEKIIAQKTEDVAVMEEVAMSVMDERDVALAHSEEMKAKAEAKKAVAPVVAKVEAKKEEERSDDRLPKHLKETYERGKAIGEARLKAQGQQREKD